MFDLYSLGTLVIVSGKFTLKSNGGAVDPDTVQLSIESPDGVLKTYTYNVDNYTVRASDGTSSTQSGAVDFITHDGTGQFSADVNANQHGHWYCRFFSSGNGQAANETHFEVKQPRAI
jgi:hypothetical protein